MSKPSEKFPIHKKIKKNELIFEYIMIGVLVLFFSYLVIYVLKIFPNFTARFDIIPVATAFLSLYALLWQVHSAIKSRKEIVSVSIDAKVKDKNVVISCSITNDGTKSIYPFLTNLYINSAKYEKVDGVTRFLFEPITQHELSRLEKNECFDCKIAQHCKKEGKELSEGENEPTVTFPKCMTGFEKTTRYCCNLEQLSYVSLLHIMPKETFKQDIVLNIPEPGYYRAFVIYTDKDWDDCTCSSTVFKID